MSQPNELELQEIKGKTENFIEENKTLVGALAAIILLIGAGVFFYNSSYVPGQEKAAQNDLFKAQQYFEKDSFNLALNGDGNFSGFLQIIEDYSGSTKAVNLANYYAGVSFLNQKNYDEAIEYLGNFDSSDDLVQATAYSAMGDAYAEKGDMDKGIQYYKMAANHSENDFSRPFYLLKAAQAYEYKEDFDAANKLYEEIAEKYPNTDEGRDAKKYLARIKAS